MHKIYSRITLIAMITFYLFSVGCLFAAGDSGAGKKKSKQRVLITVDEALGALLPDVDEIREEWVKLSKDQKKMLRKKARVHLAKGSGARFKVYHGLKSGKIIASVIRDSVQGKWGVIKYLVKFSPEGKVQNIVILKFSERRGKAIANQKFLSQYIGKSVEDKIKLRNDIDGITGATISSKSITDGIRKLTHLYHEFINKE